MINKTVSSTASLRLSPVNTVASKSSMKSYEENIGIMEPKDVEMEDYKQNWQLVRGKQRVREKSNEKKNKFMKPAVKSTEKNIENIDKKGESNQPSSENDSMHEDLIDSKQSLDIKYNKTNRNDEKSKTSEASEKNFFDSYKMALMSDSEIMEDEEVMKIMKKKHLKSNTASMRTKSTHAEKTSSSQINETSSVDSKNTALTMKEKSPIANTTKSSQKQENSFLDTQTIVSSKQTPSPTKKTKLSRQNSTSTRTKVLTSDRKNSPLERMNILTKRKKSPEREKNLSPNQKNARISLHNKAKQLPPQETSNTEEKKKVNVQLRSSKRLAEHMKKQEKF